MNALHELQQNASLIEQKIGYTFKNHQLMALAFVHRSFINENRNITFHNERLEFLGDSILGLLIADHLYQHLPETPEGELSYLRSRLVEASSCVSFIQKLKIEEYLLLGKGERLNDGRGRDTILADLFEALIGAIYLDGGIESAKAFLFNNFIQEINSILAKPLRNWKALLQDFCQKQFQQTPTYSVLKECGPDHKKEFEISVSIKNKVLGKGMGSSKKEAQQAAAENALSNPNAGYNKFV